MAIVSEASLLADLQSISGDGLRCVATYDEDGYDIHYVQDELRDRADDVGDGIYENLLLDGIATEYLEAQFAAGDLQYTLHEFEELQAYHFVAGETEGLFVSFDTGTVVETGAVKAVCYDHLDGL